jgi:hypothetical protein
MARVKAPMLSKSAAIAGLALLVVCQSTVATAKKKPAPPTPRIIATVPPPAAPLSPQLVPYRPVPPNGVAVDAPIPPRGGDGVRETVIARMNPLEAVWNFRAAWNVAALNCLDPRYEQVLDGYKLLLKDYEKRLTAVNRELDRQYRQQYGGQATRNREAYMTKVYNYFASPNAQSYFCAATLEVSREALAAPPEDLDAFALANIQRLAGAFEQFYRDFEKYQVDVAIWDAEYGPLFQRSTAPSTLYANAGPTEAGFDSAGRVQLSAPAMSSEGVSQPVIQPLPAPGTTR